MCTLSTTDLTLVEDAVQARVNKNEMFTAHDIGVEVVRNGNTSTSPRELRLAVHELFGGQAPGADGGWFATQQYDRTLIDVGDRVRPWLYHPVGADLTPYTKQFQTQTATPKPSPSAPSNPLGIAQPAKLDDDDDDDGDSSSSSKNQTGVAYTVVGAGGDIRHIPLGQGSRTVGQPRPYQTLKNRQNADNDGRVFIGPDCLSKLGLKSGDKVVLKGDGPSQIAITKGNGEGDYTVNADLRIRVGAKKRETLGLSGDSFRIDLKDNDGEKVLVVSKAD